MSNTKPLFAALIKGLTSPISDIATMNVNIVNAELIAKERGILVSKNEITKAPPSAQTYSSLVTLVARPPSRASSLSRAGAGAFDSPDSQAEHGQGISSASRGGEASRPYTLAERHECEVRRSPPGSTAPGRPRAP